MDHATDSRSGSGPQVANECRGQIPLYNCTPIKKNCVLFHSVLAGSSLCTHLLPDRSILQFRDQHPAAPCHQVSLCGHLATWGITVHLADTFYLSTATQTHIGWRVHLCGWTHRSWEVRNRDKVAILSFCWRHSFSSKTDWVTKKRLDIQRKEKIILSNFELAEKPIPEITAFHW